MYTNFTTTKNFGKLQVPKCRSYLLSIDLTLSVRHVILDKEGKMLIDWTK